MDNGAVLEPRGQACLTKIRFAPFGKKNSNFGQAKQSASWQTKENSKHSQFFAKIFVSVLGQIGCSFISGLLCRSAPAGPDGFR